MPKRLVDSMEHHFREELMCQCLADWHTHQADPQPCPILPVNMRPDLDDNTERDALIVAAVEAGMASTAMIAKRFELTSGSIRKIYVKAQEGK